jgi:1-acyl-sn-glycerol-3-phosphate acyltransferase
MFPEGTRQSGPIVEHVFDGVAYLALRTGTPIVPVGIGGSERALPRGSKLIRPVKVALVIGAPIPVAAPAPGERVPRRAVKELTAQLTAELQRLFDEAQAKVGG